MLLGRADPRGGLRMCGAQWQSLFLNSDAASIRVNRAPHLLPSANLLLFEASRVAALVIRPSRLLAENCRQDLIDAARGELRPSWGFAASGRARTGQARSRHAQRLRYRDLRLPLLEEH
jgi:hypothetical protein